MIMIGPRHRRSAYSRVAAVAAFGVGGALLAGGCPEPPRAGPPPSASTPPVAPSSTPTDVPSDDPTADQGAALETRLQRVGGVSDTYTVADPNDLDCEPGDADASRIHVEFTAMDAGAMKRALLTGRDFAHGSGI